MRRILPIFLILFFVLFSPKIVFASAPSIFSINPAEAIADSDITLTSGYPGFGSHVGVVYIDGSIIDTSSWTDYTIVAHIPLGISAGVHNLTVRNSTGEESLSKKITVQLPPEIYSISPASIYPGITWMCIVGNNFGSSQTNWSGSGANSTLKIDGIELTKAAWSNRQICFTAPSQMKASGSITLQIKSYPAFSKSYTLAKTGPSEYTKVRANDPWIRSQYYLDVLGVHDAWNIRSTSPNVVVAVIDDGIYVNHPDLKGNFWTNKKEITGNGVDDDKNGYSDDAYGYNFISNNGEMTVKGSHGTHVAGIIGAVGNNGDGIAGITWQVKLMPLIACDSSGCPREAVIKAIKYAANNGANVINLSLGANGTLGFSNEYDAAVRYAYDRDVVIVAAAGNGDIESAQSIGADLTNIPLSPVCNDLSQNAVLGVSGVDDQSTPLQWANYGKCADVYAPGVNILSTAVPALDDDFFSKKTGTSFSAPIVAGLAALLKGQYPSATNREIIDLIISTASTNNGVRTVNINAALHTSFTPSNKTPIISPPQKEDPVAPSPVQPKKDTPIKPKVDEKVSPATPDLVFTYDAEKSTPTSRTSMTTSDFVSLRSCPSKTCDEKGVYPANSLFVVQEKYEDKETWYRGEMPDGNIGWIQKELLELANIEQNTSSNTQEEAGASIPPKKSFWTKIIGWLKFWN